MTSMRSGTTTMLISTPLIRSSWICRRAEPHRSRYGGELFPNMIEAESGLVFAEFFQNERDTGRKGIVVLKIGGRK